MWPDAPDTNENIHRCVCKLAPLESDQRDDSSIPCSPDYQIAPDRAGVEAKPAIPAHGVTGERVCMHVLCTGSVIQI